MSIAVAIGLVGCGPRGGQGPRDGTERTTAPRASTTTEAPESSAAVRSLAEVTKEVLEIADRILERLGGTSEPLGGVVARCAERRLVDFTVGHEITPAGRLVLSTLGEVRDVVEPLGFEIVDRLEDDRGAAWTFARRDDSSSTVIVAELNYGAAKMRVMLTTPCALPGPGDPVPPEDPEDLPPVPGS